jgi:hypothetical protein
VSYYHYVSPYLIFNLKSHYQFLFIFSFSGAGTVLFVVVVLMGLFVYQMGRKRRTDERGRYSTVRVGFFVLFI